MANNCSHFKALLKKNWILFKRSPCGSCCEIVTPIVFVLFLLAVRSLVTKSDVLETSYITNGTIFTKQPNISVATSSIIKNSNQTVQAMLVDMLFSQTNLVNCFNTPAGGAIALSPSNTLTQMIQTRINDYPVPPSVIFFNSMDDMNAHITSPYYGSATFPYLCFGVAFTSSGENNQYEYNIRFNSSRKSAEVYNTISSTPTTVPFVKQDFTDANLFIDNGFLTVQNWIDNIILQVETGDTTSEIDADLTSVRIPAYTDDNIAEYLQGQTNIFLVLPLILPFLRMIYRLLYEKEKKIREGMKMMGMTNLSFYSSWIVTYLIIYTIICIINAIILTHGFFTHSNGFFIFFFLWFFCIVLIFQALFVSVFFTRVKSGIIGGIVFFFVLYIINYIVTSNADVTFQVKQEASLSSHAAMSFAAETLLVLETNGAGIDRTTMTVLVDNYKLETFFQFEFINIIIFSILSIYLDQVFPNEFGQKKHPLFFINWIWRSRSVPAPKDPHPEDIEMHNLNKDASSEIVEAVDSNLKQQEIENQALLIKNLSKVYPNGKKAVNDLSLNMYQNQIFVLLGHNGAGKTTTISILTGMLSPSSGTASILGRDIRYDMELLRSKMGVCPQHDILFDTLTIEEHLRLFAAFKGMKAKDIPKEVDKIIDDVDLRAKRFDLAKNLSGGQKRRLSVGIAFIGGSKLILLDEPTSGMDTSARRYIWEMLKNYKNDRIVILTTHFMDEADFLGDRIAIMGEGVLKCCGSSVFLKNKFGVGYNLIIAKKSADQSTAVEDFVLSKIKTAACISRVAAETAFQLPLAEMPNFKDLFIGLDEKMNELNIASYGISITTLEEVFLKVAQGGSNLNGLHLSKEKQDNDDIDDFDLNSVKIKSKTALFFVHFWAIFIKRLQYFKRDKKGLVCEILMPCAVVGLGLCITFIQFVYQSPPLIMSPQILTLPVYVPVQYPYVNSFYNSANFPGNYYNFLSNPNMNNNDLPTFDEYEFQARSVDSTGIYGAYFIQSMQANRISYMAFYNSTTPATLPILMNSMNQAFIRYKTGQPIAVTCINYPFPLTQQQKTVTGTASGFIASFIFSIAYAFIPASLVVFIVKERQQSIKHQQLVSGVSLISYWSANYILDFVKLTIPLVFSVLMCLAFQISTLTDTSEAYGAIWLIFIFYSSALISFAYFLSFLFKDYGNAQSFNFVFAFLVSAILSLVIFVLRLIPSSRSGAKIASYFLRIFPPFCFGYGIINVSNRSLYAIIEGYYVEKGALSTDIAAWDIIYLAIESVVYMVLVFIIEKLMVTPKFLNYFSNETNIPYQPIDYDDDVAKEMTKIETASPADYAVFVKDLRKVYMLGGGKKKVAVTKSSFGIENGECFGLLGVNGAGKTTTFKMLCGEIPPTSGTAYIGGLDITTQLDAAREHIGYCPQFDALLENLTAKEHLFLYAAIKGIPYNMRKDLVEKKLVEMNLKQYENVCAGTYSGGNKRKLSVAIAMLGNPPIVFLDEPSTGMDPEARRFMWNVISRISTTRKRSAIILTTHSMEEAEALSTRISIMVNGTLKCLGSVQHIKTKFGKGYEIEIKTVLPDINQINTILTSIKGNRGERIFTQDLQPILERLGKSNFMENFQNGRSASHLAIDLVKQNGLAIEVLIEYIVIEDYGTKIMNFLAKELGPFTVLEHFQSFYRFKLNAAVSIGKLFGTFEDNKANLNISQYSIRQATIEQIFNMFATEQDNQLAEYQEPPQIVKKQSILDEIEKEKEKQQKVDISKKSDQSEDVKEINTNTNISFPLMQFPVQEVRTPTNRNQEIRTPRSVHSRSSNQRQELSPFVGGKRNNEYINPTYESKLFQERSYAPQNNNFNYNQPQPQYNYQPQGQPQYNQPQGQPQPLIQNPPRTPQKSGPKSIVSNSSSNSQVIDMVCTNCINKHLMMQKKDRDRMEKEKDQLLRQIAESNYQNAMKKEMEKQKMAKEQYKNDAFIQLEQINNKKVKEESVKKSQRNDPNSLLLNNGDHERYQKIQELQKELRSDLLKQINNKEMEKQNEKFNPVNYKTTLDIGEYRPRTVNSRNYGEDLRDQISWKENQKQMEKENDRKLAEAQKDVDRRFNDDNQSRKYQLENQRKDELKRAYQDYIQNKMRKMQNDQTDKEKFNESQQRLKEDMERQQYQDYLKRKEMEKTVGETVKNQMEYNNLKKKMDKTEASSSPMNGNLCMHKNKMVSCSECNKQFPKQQLCKRSESPLKFTPKKLNE